MKACKKQKNDQKAKTVVQQNKKNSEELLFKAESKNSSITGWYIDSGAASHMTNDKSFTNLKYDKTNKVTVANGQEIFSQGIGGNGEVYHKTYPNQIQKIHIISVLYVPVLDSPLSSVKKICEHGYKVIFEKEVCKIMKENKIFVIANINNNLYRFECQETASFVRENDNRNCIHFWHHRLGHRNPEVIRKLVCNQLVNGVVINDCNETVDCTVCIRRKLTRKPFPKESNKRAKEKLELVHSDIFRPMRTLTPGKSRYFLTFTDDYSRYTVIYFLNSKDEVSDKLEEYVTFAENGSGIKVR